MIEYLKIANWKRKTIKKCIKIKLWIKKYRSSYQVYGIGWWGKSSAICAQSGTGLSISFKVISHFWSSLFVSQSSMLGVIVGDWTLLTDTQLDDPAWKICFVSYKKTINWLKVVFGTQSNVYDEPFDKNS